MVTEADFALGFVAVYAGVAVQAVVRGDEPDDLLAYFDYCCRMKREPTEERLELARDAIAAVRELLGYADSEDTLLPEEVVGVASRELRERLEVMGWRAGFLTRPAIA